MAKKKKDTDATKITRTGEKDFIVHHEDGSHFECQTSTKAQLDHVTSKTGGGKKLFSLGGFGSGKREPLHCDECKERVGKITIINGQSLCKRCV